MAVRSYAPRDYEAVIDLYKKGELYGGQYDPDRDSKERLSRKIMADTDSILVYEINGTITGTVSLIEDERVAWLFRFATSSDDVAGALYDTALEILKARGHKQVLVYAPLQENFSKKYTALGMAEGGAYACYWASIS